LNETSDRYSVYISMEAIEWLIWLEEAHLLVNVFTLSSRVNSVSLLDSSSLAEQDDCATVMS
jgi:hypothetical protein